MAASSTRPRAPRINVQSFPRLEWSRRPDLSEFGPRVQSHRDLAATYPATSRHRSGCSAAVRLTSWHACGTRAATTAARHKVSFWGLAQLVISTVVFLLAAIAAKQW